MTIAVGSGRGLLGYGLLVAVTIGVTACVKSPTATIEERRQIAEQQQDPERLVRYARAFSAMGDFTRAEQYLELARQQGADHELVLWLQTDACIRDQRYRDAIEHTEEYLRHEPEDHRARFLLATLRIAIGDTSRARAALDRLLAEDPDHADAHFALAVVHRDYVQNRQAADQHFRAYLRLAPAGSHSAEASNSLLQELP